MNTTEAGNIEENKTINKAHAVVNDALTVLKETMNLSLDILSKDKEDKKEIIKIVNELMSNKLITV